MQANPSKLVSGTVGDQDDKEKGKFADKYETQILQSALTKIGKLLALSFGEAGS